MIKRMSLSETIFLFFLALIIFGPKKLPEIARQVGKYMNEFKRASNEFKAQIESEINSLETEVQPQILPPLHAPLNSLASRIFWLMLAISALCIVFCLSVSVEDAGALRTPDQTELAPAQGRLTLGFGAFRMHNTIQAEVQVGLVELKQLLQQCLQLLVFLAHCMSRSSSREF